MDPKLSSQNKFKLKVSGLILSRFILIFTLISQKTGEWEQKRTFIGCKGCDFLTESIHPECLTVFVVNLDKI